MNTFSAQMIDLVGDMPFDDGDETGFADGSFALLAAALAKLPEAARERYLADIEHDLRRAVRLFEPCGPSTPYPKANGNSHAH
jgi:hypothetical protein